MPGKHLANNPVSLADVVAEMNDLIDNARTVPDDRAKVANLMFMLEGQENINGLVSANKDEGLLQCMVGLLDSARLKAMIESLDAYIASMERDLVEVRMASLSPADRVQVMQYRAGRTCEELASARREESRRWELRSWADAEQVTALYRDTWPSPDPATVLSGSSLSPAELQGNKDFRSEVEGELAGLSQLTTAVPEKMFRTLGVSSASQAAPHRIAFDVHYTGIPLISWHLDQSVLRSQGESLVIAIAFIFCSWP